MFIPYLFLLAIPLNLIGFQLKHRANLHNKLIPVILTIISMIACGLIGFLKKASLPDYLIHYGFFHGILVSSVAINGWDSSFGVRTVIKEIMALENSLILTSGGKIRMDETIKKWHLRLFKEFSVVIAVMVLMAVICLTAGKTGWILLDYLVFTGLISGVSVVSEDLVEKIFYHRELLKWQYSVSIGLTYLAIGTFSVAYMTSSMLVFKIFIFISIISTILSYLGFRHCYIPALRTQEEVIQGWMKRKWKVYDKLTDAEVLQAMLKDIKYYFKDKKWKAGVNTSQPLFFDSENNPQTATAASNSNPTDQTIMSEAKKYFTEIINTREVK